MKHLSRTWLSPGEKLEAFRDENMLRLVTSKPKAGILIRDLDEILMRARTKTIPLTLVYSDPLDDVIFEEVGRVTNTHITKSYNQRRVSSPQDTLYSPILPTSLYANTHSL